MTNLPLTIPAEPAESPFGNPWQPPARGVSRTPAYICVCGNTASGKSTLLRQLTAWLHETGTPTIGIDEKWIHHPFLESLFERPADFAFEIQLNFMLQRVLVARSWLDRGYNVVMERSHFDDPIFARHLLRTGYIGEDAFEAYMGIWRQLATRLIVPNLLVYLDVEAEESLRRLTRDEETGMRVREFPNEELKRQWVGSWAKLYRERFTELAADEAVSHHLRTVRDQQDLERLRSTVTALVHSREPSHEDTARMQVTRSQRSG